MGVNYKRTKRWYDRKPWSEIADWAGGMSIGIICALVVWLSLKIWLVLRAMV